MTDAQRFITRIAPSPTGTMHLGTARTAYINYLAAKASGGQFILRIDDTDIERNKDEYTKIILDSLDWLELTPDKVEKQSDRVGLYQEEARGLLNRGKAIELPNHAIALRCPYDLPRQFYDTISGWVNISQTNVDQIDGKLILLRGYKKNDDGTIDSKLLGSPTYQFASVVDDYFMGVNWIIRGTDHITNTPKQIAIWQAMNEVYNEVQCHKSFPQFSHMGMIMYKGPDDVKPKKLSKRDGAASLLTYREQGYYPEAILNWMLLLGWSLKVPRGADKQAQIEANKPISKDRAIELFFNGSLKNTPCLYNLEKLNALQKEYS